MFFPKLISHHGHSQIAPGNFFFREKRPAGDRCDSEDGKKVGAHHVRDGASRISFFTKANDQILVSEKAGEDRVLIADVAKGWIGKCPEALRVFLVLGKKLNDFRGPRVVRRLEQHHIDQTEDGGVYADAKSEHGDGSRGKAG